MDFQLQSLYGAGKIVSLTGLSYRVMSAAAENIIHPRKFISHLFLLILTGCSYPAAKESTPTVLSLPSETPTPKISRTLFPAVTLTIPTGEMITPVSDSTSASGTASPTALFQFAPMGMLGLVTAPLNVRTGPAQHYPSIGMLNPDDLVKLTGRALGNLWYQIEYAEGPDGRAWVASGFVNFVNGDPFDLPRFDNQGRPIP